MSGEAEFDYVVAGAGSAGCALAARLCEKPDVRVALVEAGGARRSLFSRMPAGNGFLFGHPEYDWRHQSAPQPGLGGRRVYYPRGRGVGGSSLLNGMIYVRGHPSDYDGWSDMGLEGWSYAETLPYFRRAEGAAHQADSPYHGADGPLRTEPARGWDRVSEAFAAACGQAGASWTDDFNGVRQEGVGRFDTTVARGVRQSAAAAYLDPPPRNLALFADTRALAVEFEGGRAVGLRTSQGTLLARREVALCLGSFGSPQMLMLSGIGPGSHLQGLGIPVLMDMPGVGANLKDHPNMPMQYGMRDPRLSAARHQRLDRALWLGLRWLLFRSGPGAAPFWSVGLFHSLHSGGEEKDSGRPDLEVYCTPMFVREEEAGGSWSVRDLLNVGRSIFARGKTAAPGMQIDVNLLRPGSSGTVRLASPCPSDPPVIDPNWFADESDLAKLMKGVRHMRRVMAQPAFAEIADGEISPGAEAKDDETLAESVRRLVTTGHHPVATCRMGPGGDPSAVLDATLRVRGVEGLRVVDASSFPQQIRGNPNAPVIMLAEKAADMMLGRPPLPAEDPRSA